VGLAPVIAAIVYSNIGPSPGGAPLQAAALLLLLIPAGFAYAVEVHQVFDFHWRRGKGEPGRHLAPPTSPPIFPAGDARATVDAVASDLHSRLGLSHCAVYWLNGNAHAELVTWLGDMPPDGAPQKLPPDLLQAIDRLHRPVNLEEVSALSEAGSAQAQLTALDRVGARILVPLFASEQMRAVLSLGPRLSEDVARPEWRAGLREYTAHASLAVEHAEFHDERVHQARVDRELELARGIQERLLPSRDPSFPTLSCAGASVPSGRVCGDYYDYVELGPRRFGVAVGDVCGKGVPAALLVSHVQAALRLRALGGTPPAAVLAGVNRDLARFHQPEKFVCLAYAVVDARERSITWANGGINPPLLARPGSPVETLPTGDLILGIDADGTYEEWTQRLEPGETFIFLTDGILDARRGEDYFGTTDLEACVERWAHLRAPCLRDRLLGEARAYHRTGLQDDMTILVLQGL
jgi:serine phosphatase RsbU (regulator of sigma subunit)